MLISIRTWPSFKHQPFVQVLLFEGAGFKMRVCNTGLKPSRHDASQPKGNLPKVATKSRREKPVAILQPVPEHRAALWGRTWHFSLLSPMSPCRAARPPRCPQLLFPCHLQAGLGVCQVSRGERCWKQPRRTLRACFAPLVLSLEPPSSAKFCATSLPLTTACASCRVSQPHSAILIVQECSISM